MRLQVAGILTATKRRSSSAYVLFPAAEDAQKKGTPHRKKRGTAARAQSVRPRTV